MYPRLYDVAQFIMTIRLKNMAYLLLFYYFPQLLPYIWLEYDVQIYVNGTNLGESTIAC